MRVLRYHLNDRPSSRRTQQPRSMLCCMHSINWIGLQASPCYNQRRRSGPPPCDQAVSKFASSSADALISVCASKPASWLFEIDSNGQLSKLVQGEVDTHSQNAKPVYAKRGYLFIPYSRLSSFIPPGTTAFEMSPWQAQILMISTIFKSPN